MDVELLSGISNLPFILNNEFHDSISLAQNKTCSERCKEKDCLNLFDSYYNKDYICSKGYNNYLHEIGDTKVIYNGLIYNDNKDVPQGRKDVRRDYIIERKKLVEHTEKLSRIENYIEKRVNETIEKNFSMFHDFKTSMTIFFSCTQDIINKLPGNTFLEKIEGSDRSYKDLYNSLELITSQLRMVDVIINPKSIIFGSKRNINIFQLFEKITKLFNHLSTKKRDINIEVSRETWIDNSYCYESIEFIPLILLDNALKYSVPNSTIEIKFEQSGNNVRVIIKNIGPIVSDENENKIFEKFFRDPFGEEFSKEGIGMGLYIAQQILLAHDSKLNYFKDVKENKLIGLNIFTFELPLLQD
ncbi:sensor histidine kinase [Flavobacterium psychrotrophum]|uniref:sensor histidine kinase n=1 Tax=Flavobacterium psychrotrophum TaxID=2294119 RepID=UPI000E31D79A|nr:HAMP domain-containing sensor histidine kinase [Flavobacterium psychrotrophum]